MDIDPITRELINAALAAVHKLGDNLHGEELFGRDFQAIQLKEIRTYRYKSNDFVVMGGLEEILRRNRVLVTNTSFRPGVKEGAVLLVLGRHAHHWLRRRQFAPSQASRLTQDDFRLFPTFVGKIFTGKQALSRFIWEHLLEKTKTLITLFHSNPALEEQLREALLEDLNRIADEEDLNTEWLLRGVILSGETKYAQRLTKSAGQRGWLNRSILADAYASFLIRVPSSFMSVDAMVRAIEGLNKEAGRVVWSDPNPDNVFKVINKLRTALGEAELAKGLIETGPGYRISTPPWNIAIIGESLSEGTLL